MHCWPGHLRYPKESAQHSAWHMNSNTSSHKSWPAPDKIQWLKPAHSWTKLICMASSMLCIFSLFHTYPLPRDGRLPNHRTAAHPQALRELSTGVCICPPARIGSPWPSFACENNVCLSSLWPKQQSLSLWTWGLEMWREKFPWLL